MEISKEKKQQDFVTNKLLAVFTMVFVGIFVAMYLYKMANSSGGGYVAVSNIVNVLFYGSIAGALVTGVKTYLDRNKTAENPFKLITAKHLCAIFIVIMVCATFAKAFSIFFAVKYIYITLTAIAVQYLVLVTYTKDIYLMAITNIANLILVYLIGVSTSKSIVYAGLSIVFLALCAFFVKKVQANGGKVKEYLIFKKNTNYKMLMLNMAILALITIASVVLASFGYSIGVVIGGIYLIVIIFYNTLKLL